MAMASNIAASYFRFRDVIGGSRELRMRPSKQLQVLTLKSESAVVNIKESVGGACSTRPPTHKEDTSRHLCTLVSQEHAE